MTRSPFTRRDFLRTAAGAVGAAGLGGVAGCLTDAALPVEDGTAATAIVRSPDYGDGIFDAVEQGLRLVPPPDVVGKRVLLKPNLVDLPRDDRPVVTHPMVVVAVAEALRRRGAAEILVGDGPALQRDAMEILDAAGLTPLLDEHGLPFVDLNTDDLDRVPNPNGASGLADLHLARTAARADVLVSLPKMKTHHWAGVSLAMKGLFGVMPAAVYGWPRSRFHRLDLHSAVLDFNRLRPADYCVVDGVTAMEGDGPIRGTAVALGVLVFGGNATAVDATCTRIMGLRPELVRYLHRAAGVLGPVREEHIEQRGESIASVARRFAVVSHLASLIA